MPKATVNTQAEKYDLATCPGGYVELRRMPYGKWLHRQEIAMKMTVGNSKGGATGELSMANEAVTNFEFRECIVDHNLEDENGAALNFQSPQALAQLDPKIGDEIGNYITEMHQFESGNSLSE